MKLRKRLSVWAGSTLAGVAFAGCMASPQVPPARTAVPSAVDRPQHANDTTRIDLDQAAAGWRIAKDHCSQCHAIDASSPSPRREAPPLRHVLELYPDEVLADHFIEGVRIGHDDMPRFDFTVKSADALIAYLKTIKSGHKLDMPDERAGS